MSLKRRAYKKIMPEFYKKQEIGYIALIELLDIILDAKKEIEIKAINKQRVNKDAIFNMA
jgi:hypothetical protein